MVSVAGDGGFLWLVGNILGAVDSGFSYQDTAIGMQSRDDDGSEQRYVESRTNLKGERNHIAIVETRYEDWRNDQQNVRDIHSLNDPYDHGAWGPGLI